MTATTGDTPAFFEFSQIQPNSYLKIIDANGVSGTEYFDFTINTLSEGLKSTTEVIKRLPDFPEIMDKANQALTFLASGQIPHNSNSYTALNEKKSEMIAFRNQSIVGLLLLVIFGLLVF
jgi:hypothetical protein